MFEKLEIFRCDDDNTPQPVEPSVVRLRAGDANFRI